MKLKMKSKIRRPMKYKTKKRIQGSISVLLIIILVPMMVLSAVMVDTSRLNMARSMVSSSGDLAMNAALANYDTILKDVYGLFAVSQEMSDEDLAASIQKYFENTLVGYGVVSENGAEDYVQNLMGDFSELIAGTNGIDASNFLEMSVPEDGNFSFTRVKDSSLGNADVMRAQIVEYMKYRAPLEFGMSFFDALNSFSTVNEQMTVVEAQVAAQEATQDITQQCQIVIEEIRDYDDLVSAMQGDSYDDPEKGTNFYAGKTVYGLAKYANPEDKTITNIVQLKDKNGNNDYNSQLDKYRGGSATATENWDPNYRHINKLNLVFLGNPPEIDDLYLKDFNYKDTSGTPYITSSNITFNGNPISWNEIVVDGSGVEVEDITEASDTAGALSALNSYMSSSSMPNANSLKDSYGINSFLSTAYYNPSTGFKDGQEDNAINTYIDFERFVLDDSQASIKYSKVKAALEELATLKQYWDAYEEKIDEDIDTAKEEMDEAQADYNAKKAVYDAAVSDLEDAEAELESAESDLDDAEADLASAEADLAAAEAANPPVDTSSYEDAVDDAEDDVEDAEDDVEDAEAAVDEAEAAVEAATEPMNTALEVLNEKKQAYNNLLADKYEAMVNYANYVQNFETFTNAYQMDLHYYGIYQECAKYVINEEVVKISEQFKKISENLGEIVGKVETLQSDIVYLCGNIETYNEKVDAWEDANDGYNHSDSFSDQNTTDIETARSEYNEEAANALKEKILEVCKQYQDFNNYVKDTNHYKYGSKQIGDITSGDIAIEAASTIKSQLQPVVTVDAADNLFATLYPDVATPDFYQGEHADFIYFLKPIVYLNEFLRYLNGAYPEKVETVTVVGESQEKPATEVAEDYENATDELVSGTQKEEEASGDFGYTYKNLGNLDKSGLPSGAGEQDNSGIPSETGVNIDKSDNGDVNASGGLSEQTGALDKILSGLGNALEAGMENVYITNYIFENFSYNTLIQDAVVDGEKIEQNGMVSLDDAKTAFETADTLDKYKDKTKTLSNYYKNGKNNFLYGAEIEYILYGNSDPNKNVAFAKASIYAIRFAFNCIYAFTDSEIRNMTRAAGMSVQAATLGVVPYIVVQIVLQLALAAAESAIDLTLMNNGLDVALVKTDETWVCSVSGAANMAGEMVGEAVVAAAEGALENAIAAITDGVQSVIDASAEELSGSITGLITDIENASKGKAQEFLDAGFAEIQGEIDTVLGQLQYDDDLLNLSPSEAKTYITNQLNATKDEVATRITTQLSDNELSKAIAPLVVGKIESVYADAIAIIGNEIDIAIAEAVAAGYPDLSVTEAITRQMTDIRLKIIDKINGTIKSAAINAATFAQEQVTAIKDTLQAKVDACSEEVGGQIRDLTEEEAEAIKKEVTDATNNFINTHLNEVDVDADIGKVDVNGKKTGNALASMIKFGYKDYLMLFLFLNVCVNDEAILNRTADVIQLNVDKASTDNGAQYQHAVEDFKMNDACTYVHMSADVELDMLFMNLDMFNTYVDDGTTSVDEQISADATIKYNNVYGY